MVSHAMCFCVANCKLMYSNFIFDEIKIRIVHVFMYLYFLVRDL